jgi:hypothetical protein
MLQELLEKNNLSNKTSNAKDVCEILSIAKGTLYAWKCTGKIPFEVAPLTSGLTYNDYTERMLILEIGSIIRNSIRDYLYDYDELMMN